MTKKRIEIFNKFGKLVPLLFLILFAIELGSQSRQSIPGTYNNWEMNYQLRLFNDGTLEFFTSTSMTAFNGNWKIKKGIIFINIPDFVKEQIKLKVKKDGFYNFENGVLVWDKVD